MQKYVILSKNISCELLEYPYKLVREFCNYDSDGGFFIYFICLLDYVSNMQNYVLQCKWNTMHCLMICRSTKVCCAWLKRQISKFCFKSYVFKSYIFKNREKRSHIYYIHMLYTKWNFIMYLINGAVTDLRRKIYCYLRRQL